MIAQELIGEDDCTYRPCQIVVKVGDHVDVLFDDGDTFSFARVGANEKGELCLPKSP